MTVDEFRTLAETFGGDVERWPENRRAVARALGRTPEGAAILAAERRIDLAFTAPPLVSRERPEVARWAVLQRIAEESPRRRSGWRVALHWLAPATSLAASALIGVALAAGLPYATERPDAAGLLRVALDTSTIGPDWGSR